MDKVVYNSDVIDAVKEKLEGKYTKTDITDIKGAIEDVIKDFLADGDKVQLKGFAQFESKQVDERICRNPKTGEPVTSPAHKKVVIKPMKALKESV